MGNVREKRKNVHVLSFAASFSFFELTKSQSDFVVREEQSSSLNPRAFLSLKRKKGAPTKHALYLLSY